MAEENDKLVIYSTDNGAEVKIPVHDGQVWVTQNKIAEIFGIDRTGVSKHLKTVFDSEELPRETNVHEMHNGTTKPIKKYSLDAIISVGYRVSSTKGTQFRVWATNHLSSVVRNGYALDDSPESIDRLVLAIRKARTSEQAMYERVKSVFKLSSSDYDGGSNAAHSFFAMAQDKFHYAITGKTAAQIVLERVDAKKENVGMVALRDKAPTKADVTIAKNYLNDDELAGLMNIAEQFMLFAESKAFRGQTMTMEELSFKLNTLLAANDYPVLYEYQQALRKKANKKAEAEYQKYKNALPKAKAKMIAKQPYKPTEEDFDKAMKKIASAGN